MPTTTMRRAPEGYSENEGYDDSQDDINPVDGDPGMDAIYNGTAMDGS